MKNAAAKNYNLIVFDVSGTLSPNFDVLYDGVKGLIENLHSSGKKIALATNLSRRGLNDFVDYHRLAPYLSSHISATESAFKPNPDMLEIILIETDVQKSETLMVGDTAQDIYMAQQLGIDTCAVQFEGTPFSSEILALNPTYAVTCMKELEAILSHIPKSV